MRNSNIVPSDILLIARTDDFEMAIEQANSFFDNEDHFLVCTEILNYLWNHHYQKTSVFLDFIKDNINNIDKDIANQIVERIKYINPGFGFHVGLKLDYTTQWFRKMDLYTWHNFIETMQNIDVLCIYPVRYSSFIIIKNLANRDLNRAIAFKDKTDDQSTRLFITFAIISEIFKKNHKKAISLLYETTKYDAFDESHKYRFKAFFLDVLKQLIMEDDKSFYFDCEDLSTVFSVIPFDYIDLLFISPYDYLISTQPDNLKLFVDQLDDSV